jgi:hypothetical protein
MGLEVQSPMRSLKFKKTFIQTEVQSHNIDALVVLRKYAFLKSCEEAAGS